MVADGSWLSAHVATKFISNGRAKASQKKQPQSTPTTTPPDKYETNSEVSMVWRIAPKQGAQNNSLVFSDFGLPILLDFAGLPISVCSEMLSHSTREYQG